MNAPPRDAFLRRGEGSILIEVVVAVVLLAILVVPLAGGMLSAASRADAVRQHADRVADDRPRERTLAAWTWGSEVRGAWWRPGPTLYVDTRLSGDQIPTVGLWVDGWFLGEVEPDAEGLVRVGPAIWSTPAGGELVIRARTSGGVWGPPRRFLVPGAEGRATPPVSAGMVAGAEAEVVAHAPAAGNPSFQFSPDRVRPEPSPVGVPLVLRTTLSGPSGVSLDASAQSWWMEAGRGLDVYF